MTGGAGAAMQAVRIQRGRWVHGVVSNAHPPAQKQRLEGGYRVRIRGSETSLPPDFLLGDIASKKSHRQWHASFCHSAIAAMGVLRELTRGCCQIGSWNTSIQFVVYVHHSLTVSESRFG